MSTATIRKLRSEAGTAHIVPLRRPEFDTETESGREANAVDLTFQAWLRSGALIGDMKQAIESSIFEVLARHLIANQKVEDSPFDAIYLADLTPDPVIREDLLRIERFANIVDISADITFADGWDD